MKGYFSESKKRRPQKAVGFHTSWNMIVVAGVAPAPIKFFAEDGKGLSKRFGTFGDAKVYCQKYIPTGYAVARYFDPVDQLWRPFKAYYPPHFKGKRMRLFQLVDKFHVEPLQKKPEPMRSTTEPLRAERTLSGAGCYQQSRPSERLIQQPVTPGILAIITKTCGSN